MKSRIVTQRCIESFQTQLIEEEKSPVTIEKYLRDVRCFAQWCGGAEVTKDRLIAYKQHLTSSNYAVGSINSMLISVNRFLKHTGWADCTVRCIRQQKDAFCPEEKELTKAEYLNLLKAAKKDYRLRLMLQTICSTGIRVSELKYFTVETVQSEVIRVQCKNKNRRIVLPEGLSRVLLAFAKQQKIESGPIFRTRSGKPLDRSNIWHMMKALSERAQVPASKVFPHNLRKLFARCFYEMEKDIAKLADLLGHSSINTTRIYLRTSGAIHKMQLGKLGLVVDKKKNHIMCIMW